MAPEGRGNLSSASEETAVPSLALASFCPETLEVVRALLRTLVERATERAFNPSYHLTPTGGAGKKASFATETS